MPTSGQTDRHDKANCRFFAILRTRLRTKLLAALILTQRRRITANPTTNVQLEGNMGGLFSFLGVDVAWYSENCATVELQFPLFGRLKPFSRLQLGLEKFL
jgi:hypothetical protein